MTLNIDLEDVPDAILEAVKARILANRRRLLDQQEQQQPAALQPKPQFRKFGADSRTWKRPQPAAVPSGQQTKIGTAWFNDNSEFSYYTVTSIGVDVDFFPFRYFFTQEYQRTLYAPGIMRLTVSPTSGGATGATTLEPVDLRADNDSQRIQSAPGGGRQLIVRQSDASVSTGTTIALLPVGGSSFVAAIRLESVGYKIVYDTYCYPTDSTVSIRKEYDPDLNPFVYPYTGTDRISTTNLSNESLFCFLVAGTSVKSIEMPPKLRQYMNTASSSYSPPEFVTGGYYTFTPAVFSTINQEVSFIGSDLIKAFPSTAKAIVADERNGYFSTFNPADEPVFARWNGSIDDFPGLGHGDDDVYAKYIAIPRAASGLSGSFVGQNPAFLWDWDDPAYCRRMCLALGFTAADLTP